MRIQTERPPQAATHQIYKIACLLHALAQTPISEPAGDHLGFDRL